MVRHDAAFFCANAQYYTNALRLGIFYQGEGDAGLLTVEVLLAVVVLIIATMMITGTIALNKSEKLKEGGILRSLGAKSSVILKKDRAVNLVKIKVYSLFIFFVAL